MGAATLKSLELVTRLVVAHADQNERDYAVFSAAIRDGRIPAYE